MSEYLKFNPTAMSYAYLKRGDLPSGSADFYQDAGLSREEFEVARAAQITPDKTPERFRMIEDGGGRRPKTYRHELPEMRPDFAPPNRRLYEEDWFQQSRSRQNQMQPSHTNIRRNIRDR